MQFIELAVRTATIVHGFDSDNKEIIESVNDPEFMTKLISVQRIQSIGEQYILITGSHGRVMYWEYDCDMLELKQRLIASELIIV